MNSAWDEYLALLDESAGLDELEARRISEASSRYDAEVRRLHSQAAVADRELDTMRTRNTRLQVGVRDVARQLGVGPADSPDLPLLSVAQVPKALKAAEYDLSQIRRGLASLGERQEQKLANPDPVVPVAPTAIVSGQVNTQPDERPANRLPWLVGVVVVLLVMVILLVALL